MAKKFALVPESWLSSVQQQPKLNKPNLLEGSDAVQRSELVEEKNDEEKLSELASLLPKNLQSRARMLFHYLENNVRVNDMQRIVYEDGTVGSHVIDLTRYAISPFVKSRPVDWPQFSKLLENLGVPESIIAKRSTTLLDQWKRY